MKFYLKKHRFNKNMDSSFDNLENLCQLTVDLVDKQEVTHKQIKEAIRDSLLKLAKTRPTFPVIYNDCYGGRGLSKIFEQFKEIFPTNSTDRQGDWDEYQNILRYGEYLRNKFPDVFHIVYLWQHHNLHKIARAANSLAENEDNLAWVKQQIKRLDVTIPRGNDTEIQCDPYFIRNDPDFEKLSETGKEKTYQVLKNKLDWYNNLSSCPGTRNAYYLDLLESSSYKSLLMDWARSDYMQKYRKEIYIRVEPDKSDFETYLDTNPQKWWQHDHLHMKDGVTEAIFFSRYLIARSHYYDPIKLTNDIDKDALHKAFWKMGSLGASGCYSRLALAWVPTLVDYWIYEYDGLESVNW